MNILGTELRIARERKGLNQAELAEVVSCHQSRISKAETGDWLPSRDLVQRLDSALDTDGLLGRLLDGLMGTQVIPPEFAAWADHHEPQAIALRVWSPLVVPGLLQTREYASALLNADPAASPEVVAERLDVRIQRQTVLTKAVPPMLIAIIDETVLRRAVAPTDVMVAQLEHLLDLPRTVTVQVLPADVGAHPGIDGPLVIGSYQRGPDRAYAEAQRGGRIIEDRDAVLVLTQVWETIRADALSRARSADLIREVIKAWA